MTAAPSTQPKLDLTDLVVELTEQTTHVEHYTIRNKDGWTGHNHLTSSPPLIRQLYAAVAASNSTEDGMRAAFRSSPAARLEAIDTAIRIDLAAARWVRDLGEDDPADKVDPHTGLLDHGSGTIACIRKLHGLTASAFPITRRAIERDVRQWWTWARIATGWDTPAWAPDATCAACGARGGLRVRLALHLGTCRECEATWDGDTIGLLADHIRSETHAEPPPPPTVLPCHCRLPRPMPTLDQACPRCGYATCVNARDTRLRPRDVG